MQTETKNQEEMKRYLFHETSAGERQTLEERFFADDDLFFELVDLENDLVDRYARRELKADELARFERSLSVLPERREKAANAAALQKFILEEKQTVIIPAANVVEEKQTVRQNVFNLFGFRMPILQLAGAAMLVLLAVGVGYLLFERARINEELARLRGESEQSGGVVELERRENALQEQIKQANEREQNLQNQITNERGQSDILDTELERERGEKLRLEREIEILRKQKSNLPPVEPKEIAPPAPTIATIILSPVTGGKGVTGDVKTIKISADTAKIAATLQIPKESTGETFSVKLDGAPVAENLKAQKTKQGSRFVNISLPAQKLSPDKENLLTVTGDDESRYNYIFRLQK